MSKGRKISIRKVLQTLVTLIVVAGCTVAILSADRRQSSKGIKRVEVHIRNGKAVRFLDEGAVMDMLFANRHLHPEQTPLARLDIHKMEAIVRSNPWVADAQIYVDNERVLHVGLSQRIPVVRVFERDGNSYYIDSGLQAMPLSDRYAHYTPVVTNVPSLPNDSTGQAVKGQIVGLVRFVTQHRFWNAQIAQIELMPGGNFELVPVLGKQRILLGDTARMAEKFSNLFAFYQQVSNKVGWDKYETIDLRFAGQVVASPSLPWKAPVDRALSNINWVKAIMDAEPKDDKDEAADNMMDAPGTVSTPPPAAKPAAEKPVATPPAAKEQKPVTAPAAVKPAPKKAPAPPARTDAVRKAAAPPPKAPKKLPPRGVTAEPQKKRAASDPHTAKGPQAKPKPNDLKKTHNTSH